MTHSLLNASDTKRWAACPGGKAWEATHPVPRSDTKHSLLGTRAHELVGLCLESDTNPVDHTNDYNMIDATNVMVKYVRNRIKELGISKKDALIEQKVNPFPNDDDMGGSADVILDAWPEMLEVIDYKHGVRVYVPVEGNMQLRTYALGALRNATDDYETVRYTICQPRHYQGGIKSEDITPSDLIEWGTDVLLPAAERVRQAIREIELGANLGSLALSAGDHCQFCQLKPECPEQRRIVQDTARMDFDDIPSSLSVPDDTDQIASVVQWAPMIRKFLDSAEEKAYSLMANEKKSISGLKLVRKRVDRAWDPQMPSDLIAQRLIKDYDICADDIYTEPKLKTVTQVEKLIDKEDKQRYNREFVTKPEAGLTIALSSDKREEVIIDARSDFEDIKD